MAPTPAPSPNTGRWLMFNLDGSPISHDLSLERATALYLAQAKVEQLFSSPDGEKQVWTSWRFSNKSELRYEDGRIAMWVPAKSEAPCDHCGRAGPTPQK